MTEDMQVRNFALNTQTTYIQQVSLFARHLQPARRGAVPELEQCGALQELAALPLRQRHVAPRRDLAIESGQLLL
jgi:hypothetical protein